jgi:hypothetical protein
MQISQWIDINIPEHAAAVKHLFKKGTWPADFKIPEHVQQDPMWFPELCMKIASKYIQDLPDTKQEPSREEVLEEDLDLYLESKYDQLHNYCPEQIREFCIEFMRYILIDDSNPRRFVEEEELEGYLPQKARTIFFANTKSYPPKIITKGESN